MLDMCLVTHVFLQANLCLIGKMKGARHSCVRCDNQEGKKKNIVCNRHQQCLPDTSFVPVFGTAPPTVVISPSCANIKSLVDILKKHEEKKTYLGHKQCQMYCLCCRHCPQPLP
jgi:hypothetical protein